MAKSCVIKSNRCASSLVSQCIHTWLEVSMFVLRLDRLRVTITEGFRSQGARSFVWPFCSFPSSDFSFSRLCKSIFLTGTDTGMIRGTRLLSSRAFLGAGEELANSTTLFEVAVGPGAVTSTLFFSSELSSS